jgi:hypothetical protein
VIVPNKATVYPEYLPDALTPPATPTDLDRLMRDRRAHSDVAVLDLRAARSALGSGRSSPSTLPAPST